MNQNVLDLLSCITFGSYLVAGSSVRDEIARSAHFLPPEIKDAIKSLDSGDRLVCVKFLKREFGVEVVEGKPIYSAVLETLKKMYFANELVDFRHKIGQVAMAGANLDTICEIEALCTRMRLALMHVGPRGEEAVKTPTDEISEGK